MDESMLKLDPVDLRKRVRCKKGERLYQRHIVPRVKYEGGGVIYWGVVSWLGVGPLVEIDGTATGVQYAQILNRNIGHVKRNLKYRVSLFHRRSSKTSYNK